MGGGTGTGPTRGMVIGNDIRGYFERRRVDVCSLDFGTYEISPRFDKDRTITLCGDGNKIHRVLEGLRHQEEKWKEDINRGNVYIKHCKAGEKK